MAGCGLCAGAVEQEYVEPAGEYTRLLRVRLVTGFMKVEDDAFHVGGGDGVNMKCMVAEVGGAGVEPCWGTLLCGAEVEHFQGEGKIVAGGCWCQCAVAYLARGEAIDGVWLQVHGLFVDAHAAAAFLEPEEFVVFESLPLEEWMFFFEAGECVNGKGAEGGVGPMVGGAVGGCLGCESWYTSHSGGICCSGV